MSLAHLTDDNFDAEVAGKVALIDFWAEWCGPCRMLSPIIEQIATEVAGKALVAKINVDEAQGLAKRFAVRTIPTVFILKNGEIIKQFTGVQDKTTLLKTIENA